jgi:chromosome segregation ATPase
MWFSLNIERMSKLNEFDKVYAKLSVLEAKTESNTNRIEKLEQLGNELSKLSTLMEMQIEMNKDQQKQLKEQHETLIKINENLNGLSSAYQKLDGRVETLEKNQENNKIDILQVIKVVIPSLLLAFLIYLFKLN